MTGQEEEGLGGNAEAVPRRRGYADADLPGSGDGVAEHPRAAVWPRAGKVTWKGDR